MLDHEPKTKEDLVKQYREGSLTDAACKLIAAEGFGGVTVERVAELAGVSKGTIYLYFKNKDDLIRAAIGATIDNLLTQISQATESEPTFLGKLRLLVVTQLRLFAENHGFFRALLMDREYRPEPDCMQGDIRAHHLAYLQFVTGILALGRDEGRIRKDVDLEEAAFLLNHLLQSTGFRHLLGFTQGRLGTEGEVERILSYLLHGIGSGE